MPETILIDEPQTKLVDLSSAEVQRKFAAADCTSLYYHNLEHTKQVVKAAELIGNVTGFTEEEVEDLHIAAWWHDAGMLECPGKGHEEQGADDARAFLRENMVPEHRIERIASLILATQVAYTPATPLERAMRDADLSNLGRPEYLERLENLRREWQMRPDSKRDLSDDVEWYEENIAFVAGHQYLTPAANKLYGEQKQVNLDRLHEKLKKIQKKIRKKAKKASGSDKTAIQSEKSAQMMLKTTLRNNIDLTSIADGKANIMLSISAMIISLGMPLLAAYIPQFTYLVIPAGVLLITCVLTIVYATLATRPIKTSGVTPLASLDSGKTNLFFFGNYYKMKMADYKEAMKEVLSNQEILDNSVMNDMYWLGVALGQKFNRLRICYGIFLVGMVLSVIAFVLSFYFSGPLSESQIVPAGVFVPPIDSLRK